MEHQDVGGALVSRAILVGLVEACGTEHEENKNDCVPCGERLDEGGRAPREARSLASRLLPNREYGCVSLIACGLGLERVRIENLLKEVGADAQIGAAECAHIDSESESRVSGDHIAAWTISCAL